MYIPDFLTGVMNQIVIVILILVVVGFFVYALSVWIVSKIFKFRKQDFKTALVIAAIFFVSVLILGFIISFLVKTFIPQIPYITYIISYTLSMLVSLVVTAILIKRFYEVNLGRAILATLLIIAISWMVSLMVSIIVYPISLFFILNSDIKQTSFQLEQEIVSGKLTNCAEASTKTFGPYAKELCYNKMAELNKDGYYCLFIPKDYKNSLYNITACLGKAQSSLNQVCEDIDEKDKKNTCYYKLAEIELNISICNKIISESILNISMREFKKISRDTCQSNIQRIEGSFNEQSCDQMINGSEEQNNCYLYFSRSNPSLCNKITNPDIRELCFDDLLKMKALKNKDVTFCNQMKTSRKYNCLAELAKEISNPSICEGIPPDWWLKENCIKEASVSP